MRKFLNLYEEILKMYKLNILFFFIKYAYNLIFKPWYILFNHIY